MSPNITLKRTVPVGCWRVVGQIARASKRAELVPVLLRAQERGQTNADDIAAHLFFEARARRVVAERVLEIALAYGLLEKTQGRFVLTNAGHEAIHTDQVLVPERGPWTLWACKDPLLGCRVLRVDEWREPSAFDELRGKARDIRPLPSWLNEVAGKVERPCAGDGRSLRVDVLDGQGEPVPTDEALVVEWAVGAGQLRFTGSVGAKEVATDVEPPTPSRADVWRELLHGEGLWPSWDADRQALRVGFDDTEDTERETMTRSLRIERPQIDGLGVFDPIEVSGVKLAARSRSDAERWARWRLESRIQDYATERRMERWASEAKEPFSEHPIDLPSRGDLAREAWSAGDERRPPRTWHLVAAEDWRLR